MLQSLNIPKQPASTAVIDHAAMDNLAARFRGSGLFTVLMRLDRSIEYSDTAAGLFFQRFVLPLLQFRDDADDVLASHVAKFHADSGVVVWDFLPGVTISAFPYVERKQVRGIILLAGKSEQFKLCEDVVRVCSRFGLDGIWLAQQADQLPTFSADEIQRQSRLLLSTVRDQVRIASMEREIDSLSGQLSTTYEELTLIYQLSSGMKINRSVSDFFKQVCLEVMDTIKVRGMGVTLQVESASDQPSVLYGALSLPPGTVQRLGEQLTKILQARKNPLMILGLAKDPQFNWLGDFAHQILAVPLMRQDQVLGCLFAIDKEQGEFDSIDSKLLNSIANESAIYLENAKLFGDVHGLMMGLLHSLTSAVDAKDAYTCGHSERVAMLSRSLAAEAQFSPELVERVYMAGLLHDVGKIGVPEAVLQKPGRLTPEEFEQIKKHPEIGARILGDIRQIADVIPGVLHHHERYDGKGYPHGLAGEQIPLFGRIICLADCFDAMTSSRTYRKALPLEVALTEIRRCAGTQFDPVLTDAFLRIGEETLRELLKDHQGRSTKQIDFQQKLRVA